VFFYLHVNIGKSTQAGLVYFFMISDALKLGRRIYSYH